MKIIFTEGSIHHLKTMEMQTAPRVGEEVVVDNHIWKVDSITHFPKENGLNDNKDLKRSPCRKGIAVITEP
jgi:hypothetical protein